MSIERIQSVDYQLSAAAFRAEEAAGRDGCCEQSEQRPVMSGLYFLIAQTVVMQ